MAETAELDTTTEQLGANGHQWFTTEDDQAFLNHILSKEPVEELVEVEEWEVKVLCRALNAEDRIKVEMAAYNKDTKTTEYRSCFDLIVMLGCYNPATGRRIFTDSSRRKLMHKNDGGGSVVKLAFVVLRLSRMMSSDTKKN
jgi:hypothetical protein